MTDPRSDWYDIGDVVILHASFRRSSTKALTDPTTITVTVRDPAGTVYTPAVTRTSLGLYEASLNPSVPGVWQVRWVGTGDALAAGPDHFLVRETNV